MHSTNLGLMLVALVEAPLPRVFTPSSSTTGLPVACQWKSLTAERDCILEAHPDCSQPHWIDSSLLSSRGAGVFAENDFLGQTYDAGVAK